MAYRTNANHSVCYYSIGGAEAASGTSPRQALDAKRSVAVCRTRRAGSGNPGLLARINLSFVCSFVSSFCSSVRSLFSLLFVLFVCSLSSLFVHSIVWSFVYLFHWFIRVVGID